MMSTTTLTAPISTEQINNTVYVGQGDLTTIQKAVNFAVAQGGEWRVAIPAGYTGSDSPLAVTGGSASVWIVEERNGMERPFIWFNGAYIYAALNQRAGIATPELNNMLFVGKTVDKFPTIQSAIDFSTSVPGIDFLIIVTNNYDGTEDIADLVNGSGTMQVIDQRDTTQQWAYWYWTGTNFKQAGITLEGDVLVDGDIYATNAILSGNLTVSDVSARGQVSAAGMTADSANFNACEVLNSPVRTFSNTPDAPGPSYPPAGIGVSTGTSWDPNSIDPATLAYVNKANNFIGDQTVTGNISAGGALRFGAPLSRIFDNGNAAFFDYVHAGTARGPLVLRQFAETGDPAGINSLAFDSDGNATFFGSAAVPNQLSVGSGPVVGISTVTSPTNQVVFGSICPVPDRLCGYRFDGFSSDFSKTTTWLTMYEDDTGQHVIFPNQVVQVNNGVVTQGGLAVVGAGSGLPLTASQLRVSVDSSLGNVFFDSIGKDTSTSGTFSFRSAHSDGSGLKTSLAIDGIGNMTIAGGFSVQGAHTAITGCSNHSYQGDTAYIDSFGPAGSRGQFKFRSASANATNLIEAFYIDASGNAAMYGTLAVANASFSITNPASGPTLTSVANLVLDSGGSNGIYLNYHSGTGGVHFCNGAGTGVGNVDNAGNATFSGSVTPLRVNIQNSGTMYNSGPEGMLGIDSKIGYPILMNWFNGSGVLFGNGANVQVASISNSGVITGSAKNFAIPYPGDPNPENPTRALWHSCLEGPEYAVFYRGEGMTGEDGAVRIELPEYFEDLTRPTDRTVQVTQIGNSDDEFVMLMAGRVEQGSFKVRSSVPNTAFYWEVKAVRSDMEPLDVVRTVLKGEGVFGKMPTTGEAAEEPTTPPAKEPKGKNKK